MDQVVPKRLEWLRLTLASIGDGVISTDMQHRITFMNSVAESLTGWLESEAMGKALADVFHIVNEDSRQIVESPVAETLLTGHVVDLAKRTLLVSRDGTERPIDDSSSPIRDDSGNILGVVLVFREVAERRRAEKALRQAKGELEHRVEVRTRELARANQFLSTLLESMQEGILACDDRGAFTLFNKAAREFFGLTADTISIATLIQSCRISLSHGEGQISQTDFPLSRALAGAVVHSFELLVQLPDQPTRNLLAGAQAIKDEQGAIVGAVMSMHDVTARKAAEESLQRAHDDLEARVENRTQQLTRANAALRIEAAERERAEQEREAAFARVAATMESITQAFMAVDAQWRFTYVNAQAERMYGIPRDQLIGRDLWETFPELAGDPLEQDFRRAMTNRISFQTETRLQRPNEWFVVNVFPVEGGGLSFYFQDISERKRNEAAAREHEQRFRAIVEQVKDYAIFTTDILGRPTSWNEGVQRVLGFEESEFLGRNIAPIIFTPEDYLRGVSDQELAEAAATGSAGDDRWMRKKDGTYFFANGVTTSSRDEDGKLLGFLKVMRDQTERKHMEDELRRIAADLANADHRKNEFLAMLAHELRNPLAPITNAIQIMQNSRGDMSVIQPACELMSRQISHMVRLVDDLLDVSRITRGKIDLRKSVIELAGVIQQAIETSRPTILAANQELTVSLPSRQMLVHGDAVRLAQVFSNLLNNASKYSDAGGQIWLTAECHDGAVSITVKDNGVGIPLVMLPKVFDIFIQVDQSLERSQGGLGIGLTLVKRLVELHDGTVHAFSQGSGRGCEFVVRLPLTTEAPAPVEPARTPNLATQRRILVVDDNRDSATTLAMLLRMNGNDTRTAHDGVEALEVANEFQPEVMLLDIGLPRLNGYEVAQSIRALPWGQKVVLVALTGWGQEEDRQKSRAAGFNAHLVKPLDHTALAMLMSELLPR